MRLKILLLIISTFIISCQIEENPCSLSETVMKDIQELDSIINNPETIEKLSLWNKNNYDEPLLFNANKESYRFKRYITFEKTEIYRIEKNENLYKGIIKIFNNDNFQLIEHQEKKISKNTWDSIVNKLEENNFWTYPSRINQFNGWEGSLLEIEGFRPIKNRCTFKNYHGITRMNTKDSTLKSMGKIFEILK